MPLNAAQLEAFGSVAQEKSFSRAADRLSVTQSALSQRIINLENELGVSLFVRESAGVRLTESGERLLGYCRQKNLLEEEFLAEIDDSRKKELRGTIRIASFSTFTNSVLVPGLGDFLRAHPAVRVEVATREVRDLFSILKSGQVDFIFTPEPSSAQGVECHRVGAEENVLVTSKRYPLPATASIIDHDPLDPTSLDFFKHQSKSSTLPQRHFFDEIYSIMTAVEEGVGNAVLPLHLASKNKNLKVLAGYKPLKVDIFLSYYEQQFYTRLQKALIPVLKTLAP